MDKISSGQIMTKTIKYMIIRVAVPILTIILSIIALVVTNNISVNMQVSKAEAAAETVSSDTATDTLASVASTAAETVNPENFKMGLIATLIWILITLVIYFALNFFIGYRFHAGQMAIITDAVTMKMIPEDMDDLAKESTHFRFPSGTEYLAYRNSVVGSLQQLQMHLNTFAENRLRIPVLGQLIRFCQFVIGHALTFTFDMVLCYTFWRDGKGLFTSAADGVAVYWDSWKRMLQHALALAIEIIIGMVLAFALSFVMVAPALTSTAGRLAGTIAGIFVGYLVCRAAKIIVDTHFTIKSIDAFFEEAQYADYNSETYETMCERSKKYKKLYAKAVAEANGGAAPAAAPAGPPAGGYGNDYSDFQ